MEEMSFEEFAAIFDIGTDRFIAFLNIHKATMPPTKFQLNLTYGLGEMSFEEFQDRFHLGYRKRTILAILSLCVTVMPPMKLAQSDKVLEEMLYDEFQDGRLGYRNGTNLVILNLHVATMPPTM